MRREFAKSLHLHRAVAGKIEADFDGEIAKARDYQGRHRAKWRPNAWWVVEWDRILAECNRQQLLDLLLSESDYACDPRSSSPFKRALRSTERYHAFRAFRWPDGEQEIA